ncbi:extracellular solute-binding protein [Plantactinospora veratri]
MKRRDILRRTAAAGLLAVPATGLLTGCALGGDDDNSGGESLEGTKSEQNPLGVKEDAPLEVVIFNGGFGEEYAKAHQAMYTEKYPKATIKHSATQEINKTLQPRFVDGSPPDVVNNSGGGQIDFNGLVSQGALADLGELLDAPSLDIPGKKVRDTLLPGVVDVGSYDGKFLVLSYAYTAYGIWYSTKLFADRGWQYPKTWDDHIALCKQIKAAGIAPGRTPASTPLHELAGHLDGDQVRRPGRGEGDRQPGAERLEVRGDEDGGGRLVPDRQGRLHHARLARPRPRAVADRVVPGQGRLHLLRFLAGERAGQGHPGRLQHVRGADAEPRRG